MTTHEQMKEDLENIFSRWRFKAGDLSHCKGQFLWVESIPWRRPRTDQWNLTVQMMPLGPDEDVPAEAIAGAREACEKAQSDPDPNVQALARLRLAQLDGPRCRVADLAGLRLRLWQMASGKRHEIRTAETDANARAVFTDIMREADCSIELDEPLPPKPLVIEPDVATQGRFGPRPVAPATAPSLPSPSRASFTYLPAAFRRGNIEPKEERPARAEPVETAAFAAASATGPVEPIEYFTDQRITAELARDSRGQLWLTVSTSDPELAGATVRFEFGTVRGVIQLPPKSPTSRAAAPTAVRTRGAGRGVHSSEPVKLELNEKAARACHPKFVIEPPARPVP